MFRHPQLSFCFLETLLPRTLYIDRNNYYKEHVLHTLSLYLHVFDSEYKNRQNIAFLPKSHAIVISDSKYNRNTT